MSFNLDIKDVKTQFYLVAVVAILLFMGWFIFGRSTAVEGDVLVEVMADPSENLLGRELLLSLEKMKNIRMDTDFVNDPVFQSLQDFTIDIPKQPQSRRDPFAPIGVE